MKDDIYIREINAQDMGDFIETMQLSQHIHHPWVNPSISQIGFENYLTKFSDKNNYSFLIFSKLHPDKILGVINVSNIIHGVFQNAFLSYYVTHYGYKQNIMFTAIHQVLKICFTELNLHRLEANIQPDNLSSIRLIERIGFTLEGFSKDYLFINGQWRDHKRYALVNHAHQFK